MSNGNGKDPAFLFYPKDWLADTGRLSKEEIGCYITLICHQWNEGPFSNDEEELANRLGYVFDTERFSKIWKRLSVHFPLQEDGRLANPRLERERENRKAFVQQRVNAGKSGSQKRWGKREDSEAIAAATPPLQREDKREDSIAFAFASPSAFAVTDAQESKDNCATTPSQHQSDSTSQTGSTAKPTAGYSDAFEATWAVYPKRVGGNSKVDAYKAWTARIKQGFTEAEMHAGVLRYALFVTAKGWLNTEYVKQARTFFGPGLHFQEPWAVSNSPVARAGIARPGEVPEYKWLRE